MADRIRRVALGAIALLLLLVATTGLARASVITVINTNDTGAGSLRAAILAAAPGDTINFSVSGTIMLGSSLPSIGNTLMIDGSGQSITIDGANSFQILSVNPGATLNLKNVTIAHGNEQSIPEGEAGGGIENFGTLTVTNCTFSNNTAGLAGGAIANVGALTVTNSTFSGNIAETSGGGIDNVGVLSVTNSTFSGNSAGLVKGGGISNASAASVKGTILAGSGVSGNCSGTITDAGYNISDDNSCGFTGTSVNNSATLNLDPLGLQNNGGPTQTIALEPNSQAVDFIPVASCTDQSSPTPLALTTDQRGLPRPDFGNPNFCDAGAFELQTTPVVIERNGERLQIVHSANPSGNQLNTAFTFIENGTPVCDTADDPFNDIVVTVASVTCEELTLPHNALGLELGPFVVHTVNHQSYGTFFFAESPLTISARMVELPTPSAPACGEWTMNLELTGIDLAFLGDGPFALILTKPDGDQGCLDITNAIVGTQTPPPPHGVRRRVRRR